MIFVPRDLEISELYMYAKVFICFYIYQKRISSYIYLINIVFAGRIYLAKSLPQEERVHILHIRAVDGGGLSSDVDATVYISVTGDNSHPPIFQQPTYKFTISEDAGRASIVGTVLAEVHNPGTVTGMYY